MYFVKYVLVDSVIGALLPTVWKRVIGLKHCACIEQASNPDPHGSKTSRSAMKAAELVSVFSGNNEQYSRSVLRSDKYLL